MTILSSLAIITFAALIHASFQLSLSVLTLLSGHAIGSRRSQSHLLQLTTSFVVGAATMTLLLVTSSAFLINSLFSNMIPQIFWAVACGVMFGVAVSVWSFYYRRTKGTVLWIPRSFADYMVERTKATKSGSEAFTLGLSSVLGELLFLIAPILISALAITQLPYSWQIVGALVYVFVSILSLAIVWVLISSGHSLGQIQKWRENNKYFLQFAAGAGLIILGLFVYVNQVLSTAAGIV